MERAKHTKTRFSAIGMALLAALLYGISAPIAKRLLDDLSPVLLAALLYLGAGIGMALVQMLKKQWRKPSGEASLAKSDAWFVAGMILLDIAAPIFLLIGLNLTTAANAALLNNFEIVATTLFALVAFREAIGKRMWLAIGLITIASVLLSLEDGSAFAFSWGSVLVLAAATCWGLENNCTRMLSIKDPLQVVVLKGFGAGIGALAIALVVGVGEIRLGAVAAALLLGFVAYGMSIFFYISAQRHLGAARTSAYYAAAPFIGVLISWALFDVSLSVSFFAALVLMLLGAYLAVFERHSHRHVHELMIHEHKHRHDDHHHLHIHAETVVGEHTHEHVHTPITHNHPHLPDSHHRHTHNTKS
ncbi:MAG: DMT family transporter [Bacillus subtilis]|nr:DMT family transporter [Bacillus subtilis]